ncbi:MAG: adenine phosphoribosyltransferase [Myxococcales bacterium]|jgi:adenine phosphoribosyltransferase|nr:MAG: adenine phosphoribosyltransferase [Myxococcales bacterium]
MDLKALVRDVPDFPKPGILFKDITPVLANPAALAWVVERFADRYRGKVDAVVGIESRGFVVGAPVAYALGVGLALVRKAGKLPYERHAVGYQLEYGSDVLEMHVDALTAGSRVVVLDDLLATGGTARAAIDLVGKVGARVYECAFVIELGFLLGAAKLAPAPSYALIRYDND